MRKEKGKSDLKRFYGSCVLAILIILTLYTSTVFSAIPQIINYQGSLSDSGGNPVNATLNITFTLYDVDAGPGTIFWQETQSVTVTNGLFNVQLGADGGNPLNSAIFDDPLFLGIQVDADAEMTPRQALTAVGYAFRSKTVENDTLNSLPCADGEIPKFTGGNWACAADDNSGGDITGVTAGNGLSGGGTSGDVNISADTNVLQSRVTGSCPVGQYIRVIQANGTVVCAVDADTDTNAANICPSGTFLNGDGTCDPVVTDTNAGTVCPTGSYLRGDGNCRDIGPHRFSGTVPVGGTVTIGNGSEGGQIVRIVFGDRVQQINYTMFTGMAQDGNTALKGFVFETGSSTVNSLILATNVDSDQYVAANGFGVLRGSGNAGVIKLRNNHPTLELFYVAIFGPSGSMPW